jgi:Pyruvate/2-oxoacid:ferredoxin oxidoreductase delta subunit
MTDVYSRLAKRLDSLPHGYPSTPDGVELEILRKIFSPEDAAMALRLKPLPETAATVARRLRLPPETVRARLDAMAEKGQIYTLIQRGRRYYGLAPFVVGIWEFQLHRLDREMAEMFEAYAPTLLRELGGSGPALARVIPVNRRIDVAAQVLPYDDLKALMEGSRSFRVADCLCRTERALLGDPCSHPLETCMSFSREKNASDGLPRWGREITREEALALLDRVEEEGLVHCTYNFQENPFFVCNCCSCCCGFLRGVNDFGAPHLLARSNYLAAVDGDACVECGDCTDRCPMGAIGEEDAGYAVAAERCIGCGVCAVACPSEAIRLVPRPEAETATPPRTMVNWYLSRTDHRQGLLKGVALRGWLAWEGMKMAAAHRRGE